MSQKVSQASSLVTKSEFRRGLHGMRSAMQAEIREAAREIISYVREGFERIDKRFVGIDNRFSGIESELVTITTKLEAIMSGEVLVTRTQLLHLVDELKSHGIAVDTDRLFRPRPGSVK